MGLLVLCCVATGLYRLSKTDVVADVTAQSHGYKDVADMLDHVQNLEKQLELLRRAADEQTIEFQYLRDRVKFLDGIRQTPPEVLAYMATDPEFVKRILDAHQRGIIPRDSTRWLQLWDGMLAERAAELQQAKDTAPQVLTPATVAEPE